MPTDSALRLDNLRRVEHFGSQAIERDAPDDPIAGGHAPRRPTAQKHSVDAEGKGFWLATPPE
jgi:hypothetical protein